MKNRFIFGLAFITSFLTGAGVLSAADIRPSSPDEQPNSLETDDEGRYPAAGPIHVNHVDVDLEIDQLAPNVYAFSTFEAKFVHGDPELQWDGITTSTARTANLPPGLTARRLALCKHERKGISFASQRRDQPGSRQIVSPG
jgi:hypothetical protein